MSFIREMIVEAILEYLFESYSSTLYEAWGSFEGNAGQMALVWDYMMPELENHLADAAGDWPENDAPSDYMDAMFNAHEAAEQAFSITIESSAEAAAGFWDAAQFVEYFD